MDSIPKIEPLSHAISIQVYSLLPYMDTLSHAISIQVYLEDPEEEKQFGRVQNEQRRMLSMWGDEKECIWKAIAAGEVVPPVPPSRSHERA
jgi:hypothetical protein